MFLEAFQSYKNIPCKTKLVNCSMYDRTRRAMKIDLSQMEDSLKNGGDIPKPSIPPMTPGVGSVRITPVHGWGSKWRSEESNWGLYLYPLPASERVASMALSTVTRPPPSGCPHPARPLHEMFLQPGPPSFPLGPQEAHWDPHPS